MALDAQQTEAALKPVMEMFPEPLYESAAVNGERLCLVCGTRPAQTALLTPGQTQPIVPLCGICSSDWKIYGYLILRRIRPAALMLKMTGFFLRQPFSRYIVWQDLRNLQRWQQKMQRLRVQSKASSS